MFGEGNDEPDFTLYKANMAAMIKSPAVLRAALNQKTSAGKEVFLRGDSAVQYQDLMNVIDALKAAGVQNIGMVARMPSER